jgi:hypothetical protein
MYIRPSLRAGVARISSPRSFTRGNCHSARSLRPLRRDAAALLLGGEVIISGAPGLGTTVRVRIPETPPQPSGDT